VLLYELLLRTDVWLVNAGSSQIESRLSIPYNPILWDGGARLSADGQRLYLASSEAGGHQFALQCRRVASGQKLWQSESIQDGDLTALALSPDGQFLASGSGTHDPSIRIWDAANGKLLHRLDGHSGWVSEIAFTRNGQRLISAASDQTIRFGDTATWTETQALRGNRDEIYAMAVSEAAHLIATVGKDGDLMLWAEDEKSVRPLPQSKPPELFDGSTESGLSTNVLADSARTFSAGGTEPTRYSSRNGEERK
jgi:WD40 repeat protein